MPYERDLYIRDTFQKKYACVLFIQGCTPTHLQTQKQNSLSLSAMLKSQLWILIFTSSKFEPTSFDGCFILLLKIKFSVTSKLS